MWTGSLSSPHSLYSNFTDLLFTEHAKLVLISVSSTCNILLPDVHLAHFLQVCSKVISSMKPPLTTHLKVMGGDFIRGYGHPEEGQGDIF